MAIDFPNSPSVNQIFTVGSQTWIWTGTVWQVLTTTNVGGSGGIQIASLGVGTPPSGVQGEIRATNEITAYYSDSRFKIILSSIDNALSKVKSLRGVRYIESELANSLGYNSGRLQVGVIAQEVEAVLPEAIRPAPIDPQYLTVQYEKLIPLLIEAIKELSERVEELEYQNSTER
jgi:hypothetical protein